MTRLISAICGMLLVVGSFAAAQAQAPQGTVHRPHRVRRPPVDASYPNPQPMPQTLPVMAAQQPAPAGAGAVPRPAPAPVRAPAAEAPMPDNLPPPTPPQVIYSNGLLTVQAINSTLGGLLSAIRNKTGIQFEGLEGPASERVVVSMGPAPEGEVLAAILGGSRYDYIVLDRPDSPGTVQRVLLSPRAGMASAAGAQQAARPAAPAMGDDEDTADEEASGEPEPQDTPVRPPLTQVQPPQPQPEAPTRTPEQLLEQLKQMPQQQQQQPPLNQAPRKPPPIPQL